jgi:hypothetical protein
MQTAIVCARPTSSAAAAHPPAALVLQAPPVPRGLSPAVRSWVRSNSNGCLGSCTLFCCLNGHLCLLLIGLNVGRRMAYAQAKYASIEVGGHCIDWAGLCVAGGCCGMQASQHMIDAVHGMSLFGGWSPRAWHMKANVVAVASAHPAVSH